MITKSELKLDGIELSRIALGTHTFCNETAKVSREIFDEYLKNGGNVIDTGRCYGGDVLNPTHEPESEKHIGSWLESNGMRNKVVLITKGGNPEFKDRKLVRHRITSRDIEEDIHKSLQALKTDYIDIYFVHKDNPNIEAGEVIEILSKYVKCGMVKHIGASNWSTERIEEANRYAAQHNFPAFEYSELAFSLKAGVIDNWNKDELPLEMSANDYNNYRKNKIPVFDYASQAYGFFYRDSLPANVSEQNREMAMRLKEICDKKQINAHQALFGFHFGCDVKNIPIISAKTMSRLYEVLDNCDVILEPDEVQYLLEKRFNFYTR